MKEKQKNRLIFVQKHYEMGLNINKIANILNVSKSTIQRDIKYLPEKSHKIRESNKKIEVIDTPSYYTSFVYDKDLDNFLDKCNKDKYDIVFTKQNHIYQYIIKFDTEQPLSFAINIHKEIANNDFLPMKLNNPIITYRNFCNKQYENIIELNNFNINLKTKDRDIITDDICIIIKKNKLKTIDELKNYYKNNKLIINIIIEMEKYLKLFLKYA